MEGPGLLGGRYALRDVLGFGGMAEVRDAWDERLNRAVAVKLLHPGLSSQADIRERFKVEACAAGALNHPNIVAVFDFGEHRGVPFIVMERLPGDTLGDMVALGPLPESQVCGALANVLSALAAAHAAGMLHRDIKPSNILLAPNGVKVADFGIAKTPGASPTTTGQIVGTLAYLSPARIAGEPATVADDLYAAGVVAYEALCGRKPFPQDEIAPLARAIAEDDPIPLTVSCPSLDPRLADVVERAMTRDPKRRFESADAMRVALTGGTREPEAPFSNPMGMPSRPPTMVLPTSTDPWSTDVVVPPPADRRPRSSGRRVAAAAAVLGSLAVGALAFALDSPTTQPSGPEPVSVSTPALPPVSTRAPAVPVSATVAPPAAVEVQDSPPVVEQPAGRGPGANGNNGNGNGGPGNNGHGKKPK